MTIRRTPTGFELIPDAWAADRPPVSTSEARSWSELAACCERHAEWCAMVLETRSIDPDDRRMIRIELANLTESISAYRLWAADSRPFRRNQ